MSSNSAALSNDARDRISELPPAWSAMWRAMRRGYQAEPGLISIAFGLSLLSALPDALIALWLKFIADGILDASPKVGTLMVFEYEGEGKSQRGFSYGIYYVRAQESDPAYWAKVTTPKPGEADKMAERQRAEAAASAPVTDDDGIF